MKKFYTIILCLLFSVFSYTQLMISEISYNPPESGQDSLEYIEIYNAGSDIVMLNGFAMGGVDYVFTTESIMPDDYLVLSENADAMMNLFGVTSLQWEGALSNGGEEVSIINSIGITIDVVSYEPEAPWPTQADGTAGEGASIELCDTSKDNSAGANWRAATNDTGVEIDGKTFYGTPGAANTTDCTLVPDHTVVLSGLSFTPQDLTININEVVQWDNQAGTHNVNGSTDDYPDNPEGFFSGSAMPAPWTFEHKFTKEGLYNYHCDPHLGAGMSGTVTVIDPNAPTYPKYDIGLVTTIDSEGKADSINRDCALEGIVHSINFRPGGLTFVLIDDNNDGIHVFDFDKDFGYTVNMGDRILVKGVITQFRGLIQIEPASIEMLGTGAMFDATTVTTLDESTESQHIQVLDVMYVDESQWVGDGSSFNVMLTDGVNEFAMRIDSDTELASIPPMQCTAGTLGFRGVGNQFDSDNSAPYDDGYQIFPRTIDDILCLTDVDDLIDDGEIIIAPNPVTQNLNVNTNVIIEQVEIIDASGRLILKSPFKESLDVSVLEKGIYHARFIQGKRYYTTRFTKI